MAETMRLSDAGHREQAWARECLRHCPVGTTYEDLLAHGSYDPRADEILFTFGGVCHRWRVARP